MPRLTGFDNTERDLQIILRCTREIGDPDAPIERRNKARETLRAACNRYGLAHDMDAKALYLGAIAKAEKPGGLVAKARTENESNKGRPSDG